MTAGFANSDSGPSQAGGGMGETATDAVVYPAGDIANPPLGNLPMIRPGFTALVVEDSMLIAMDAQEALEELGASEVQLCPDVAGALACIRATAFDVALLDVDLRDETSEAIAIVLRESGTPFIVITGFGDYVSGIAAYAGVPVLAKPYAPADLLAALSQVMT